MVLEGGGVYSGGRVLIPIHGPTISSVFRVIGLSRYGLRIHFLTKVYIRDRLEAETRVLLKT